MRQHLLHPFFFFNDTATTEIYTLSLHDALPIYDGARALLEASLGRIRHHARELRGHLTTLAQDRKSTRLNSSHGYISYAVFCLKKKSYHHPKSYPHAQQDPPQMYGIAPVEHL